MASPSLPSTLVRKKPPTLEKRQLQATPKRIELPYQLVDDDGNALGPPEGNLRGLAAILKSAFPTLRAVELSAPYLIVRLAKLPPSPWPFTVGGLPLRVTDSDHEGHFNAGVLGKGKNELQTIDLRWRDKLSEPIFKQALTVIQAQGIKIYEIFCLDNCWSILVPDDTDLNRVPRALAGQACCYRFKSKITDSGHAVLQAKVPEGVDFDNTDYMTTPNAVLHPGIMVSSSALTVTENKQSIDTYKTTTSGILVVNKDGEPFITVSTHGFEADGLVYHTNPIKGSVIGRIVEHLPGTDISIVKLNPGLRYTNHTFGSEMRPDGVRASGISPCYPFHLRRYDSLSMDNPYSGFAEGAVIGLGYKLAEDGEEGETDYIQHIWTIFENGNEPIDGSCGLSDS